MPGFQCSYYTINPLQIKIYHYFNALRNVKDLLKRTQKFIAGRDNQTDKEKNSNGKKLLAFSNALSKYPDCHKIKLSSLTCG